jgi:D-3-phosphoglycerate dehydrogenase / 2-oxoglutarate reductase
MRDVLIAESLQSAAVDALRQRFDVLYLPDLWRTPAQLAENVAAARSLIVRNQTEVTAAVIAAAPALLVIGRAGVGLDNIDLEAAKQAGIVIASTPDQNAVSVAELAIGLMLSLARFIPAADQDTRKGNWNRHKFIGTELYGKTFGILGAGKIGYLTASRARAFGMKILACDPFLSPDNIFLAELGAELLPLEDLLSRADVVSCHLPATPQTAGMLNGDCFRRMKPGSFFINTARGKVLVEADLLAALQEGRIAGAALDVRFTEPPLLGELETMPNVILMPHVGAWTREAQERVSAAVCNDVARVLAGEPAINAVYDAVPRRIAAR